MIVDFTIVHVYQIYPKLIHNIVIVIVTYQLKVTNWCQYCLQLSFLFISPQTEFGEGLHTVKIEC